MFARTLIVALSLVALALPATPAAAQIVTGPPQLVGVTQLTTDSVADNYPALAFSDSSAFGLVVWSKVLNPTVCDENMVLHAATWNGSAWTAAAVPGTEDPARHFFLTLDVLPGATSALVCMNTNFTSDQCKDELGSRGYNGVSWAAGAVDMTTSDLDDDSNPAMRLAADGSFALAVWSDDTGADHGAPIEYDYAVVGAIGSPSGAGWGPTVTIVPWSPSEPLVDNIPSPNGAIVQHPLTGAWIVAYWKQHTATAAENEVAWVSGTASSGGFSFGAEVPLTADSVEDGPPIVCESATGDVAVFWTRRVGGADHELMAAVWDSSLAAFDSPLQLTDDGVDQVLRTVSPGEGGWHVVHTEVPAGEIDEELYLGVFDGDALLPPSRLTTDSELVWFAHAAADEAGTTHLVWVASGGTLASRELFAGRISFPPAGTWTDVGHATAGLTGLPSLVGSGTLAGAAPNQIDLSNARPSATATLVFGLSFLHASFKGGTFMPDPIYFVVLGTDPSGDITLPFSLPTGLPAGIPLVFQYWIQDAAGVLGYSASNALVGLTP
ncbi:MAG: hypothetical protein ACT4PU_11215 [Planctomycetota bacterium]